jgi:alkyldihydroxyacetonephosphate synthase
MHAARGILEKLSPPLRARASVAVPDRVAGARDLWQRHLVRVQRGEPPNESELPAAVVRPETEDEVRELVELAPSAGVLLVPYGAGSGVCGAVACNPRTLVVDTKRMRWLESGAGGTVRIGPGLLGIPLEEELARRGLTAGHFPSSILCSTVGGWVAARGAGQCSGRYGKIEDMVAGATAVLGTGDVVTARRRRGGPELLPLLIGSEGTLGIFTELELRVHRKPEERAFAAFELPGVTAGIDALRTLYQAGLRPAVARLYDPLDSRLVGDEKPHPPSEASPLEPLGVDRHASLSFWLRWPRVLAGGLAFAERTFLKRTKLILLFEGESGQAAAEAEHAGRIVSGAGGRSLGEGPARAWYERRYAVSYEQSRIFRHDAFSDTFEVAAPWSLLEPLYENVRRALGQRALVMAHLSHAYPDGCSIYFTFLAAARGTESVSFHEQIWREGLAAALEVGGTMAHHHGVGRLRQAALAGELGAGGVKALARVKRAFDPAGILCPGSPLGAEPKTAPEAPRGDESSDFLLDAVSGLVRIPGAMPLTRAERALEKEGFGLGLDSLPELDLDGFLAAGLPGAPDRFLDPVEQSVAGFAATLSDGSRIALRPAPRRASGPDLSALFVGAGGRIGRVEHAWLRAHPRGAPRARPLLFDGERSPGLSNPEASAWDALLREFTK